MSSFAQLIDHKSTFCREGHVTFGLYGPNIHNPTMGNLVVVGILNYEHLLVLLNNS